MQKTSLGRLTIDRLSLSPIGAIVGSIHAAVEHVGRDHGLNHVVSKCVPLLPRSVCPSFLRACIIKKCVLQWSTPAFEHSGDDFDLRCSAAVAAFHQSCTPHKEKNLTCKLCSIHGLTPISCSILSWCNLLGAQVLYASSEGATPANINLGNMIVGCPYFLFGALCAFAVST